MKVLVAPLNWGLGHATRCIPVIDYYLCQNNEVVLAGDGDSMLLLRKRYPQLRHIQLPPLRLHYSRTNSQVTTLFRQLPHLLHWMYQDHWTLQQLLSIEHFDLVISDNRFAFHSKSTRCVYLTHQLHICLPKAWKMFEPCAEAIHRRIMNKYAEVWVPDTPTEPSLAGRLSHPDKSPRHLHYIGHLSRFMHLPATPQPDTSYQVVLLLSGLEPQRTLLENEIIGRYQSLHETLLVVQGKPDAPFCKFTKGNITVVPYMEDTELVAHLLGASKVIARSGYSSVMDFSALSILPKCEFIPTQGQPEQEYLARHLLKYTNNSHGI